MDRNRIVDEALAAPAAAIRRTLTNGILKANPNLALAEVSGLYEDISRFSVAGHCRMVPCQRFHFDQRLSVDEETVTSEPEVGWWEVFWKGQALELVAITLEGSYSRKLVTYVFAESPAGLKEFLVEVENFERQSRDIIHVFDQGCWRYANKSSSAVNAFTFENLILPEGLVEDIINDVQTWLDSKELYESHGLPWKRGLLLFGPPGNGKTHTIKALINHFSLPTIYVRKFAYDHIDASWSIAQAFARARKMAPAFLILEDLDTLITPDVRSYFLNEMDGLSNNAGILTIGTANNAAALDPALVNRPSRFDRRRWFSLPSQEERRKHLLRFSAELDPSTPLTGDAADKVAEMTEGFSHAMLKELVLSGSIAWVGSGKAESLQSHLEAGVEGLKGMAESLAAG